MNLLQIEEAAGLFSDVAQLGTVFALLVAIILVLGWVVNKLVKKNELLVNERRESEKESILIIKGATDAMLQIAEYLKNT